MNGCSGIVWTKATVARLFELGPDRLVPGSKMPLQRLPNPRDRAELIAYLKRMGGTPAAPSAEEPNR